MPTLIFVVLSLGSIISTSVGTGSMGYALASQMVTLAAFAGVLEMLCRYGYSQLAWALIAFMLLAPLVMLFPLLAVLMLVLWVVFLRK